jgi:acid stress-induced BolA-like protein IbaG/YrbA
MISKEAISGYIRKTLPDAQVSLVDKTGTMDHYRLEVISEQFRGMNPLNRQRSIYAALNEPMSDGRIHALEIRAMTPDEG